MISLKRTRKEMKSRKVKFKTNKKDKIDLNAIQVPLSNKFNLLDEDNGDMVTDPKPPKVAPIIVTDLSANLQEILSKLELSCDMKLMSIGRKVIPQSPEDKIKIIAALKTAQVNFFSHPDAASGSFKAVLSGLPEIPTEEIVSCMQTMYEITPTKVIMFNTKAYNKLYLCNFDKSNINMKVLRAVKTVYHHIVTWLPYRPKRTGPTQCYRCCMYGHGISSCNRYAVCMLCSGNHTMSECNAQSTDNPVFKCFNCSSAKLKHDHKANDPNCPFRAKYETSRDNARTKHKPKTTTNRQTPTNTPSHTNNVHQFKCAPTPPLLTQSYANAVQSNNGTQMYLDASASTHTPPHQSNNVLWTFAEVTTLLFNSINELNQCKSKLDQLKVIANLLQHAV